MKTRMTLFLLLCSFICTGQVASRLATSQSPPILDTPPNFMWVDRSDPLINRIFVSAADSLKIRAFQMKWWKDSTTNIVNQSLSNYTPTWASISGKPTFAGVATTGNYNDLINKPTIPSAQVNSDWSSNSGVSQILNKPSFSTVATTGSYNDLSNKPSIPSAQVNSDWTASSGVSAILNKPALSAVATTGSYNDLSSKPTIPAAQVNSDWSSGSGLSQILNKPTLSTVATSGAYNDLSGKPDLSIYYLNSNPAGYISSVPAQSFASLTGKPTTLVGYGITDAYPLSGNPSNFLTSISSGQVTAALGYTPPNPNGTNLQYIAGDGSKITFPTIPSNTSQISESGNLYYTDARARAAISLTTTGTGAATYNSGVLNIPTPSVAKRIESYSGTTNASGNYTVTFSTAFSVAPNVQATIPNQAATNQFVKVTSVSTTGFTVNVFQRNAVTLLAVEVLLASVSNVTGSPIDVLVVEK